MNEEEKEALEKFKKYANKRLFEEAIYKDDLLSYSEYATINNLIDKLQEIIKKQSYTNKKLRNKIKTVRKERDKLQKELEEKTTILMAGADKVKQLEKENEN